MYYSVIIIINLPRDKNLTYVTHSLSFLFHRNNHLLGSAYNHIHTVPNYKPDILVILKMERTAAIVEVGVPNNIFKKVVERK